MAKAKPCIRCTQSCASLLTAPGGREVTSLSLPCTRAVVTMPSTGHGRGVPAHGAPRVAREARRRPSASRSLAMAAFENPTELIIERAIDQLLRGQLRQRDAKRHVGCVTDGDR